MIIFKDGAPVENLAGFISKENIINKLFIDFTLLQIRLI